MGLFAKIWSWATRADEGQVRPGPYQLPITGGWLPDGAAMNWWQLGYNPSGLAPSAMVEACISAYSQTVATLPGDHWRSNDKGGRTRVKNSALARILRHPNDYQSISDFMLNATRNLYLDGNAYALALRNDRYEIDELHLMDSLTSRPLVASSTGDVFYQLAGNDVIERRLGIDRRFRDDMQLLVPMRDVLHIRLHVNKKFPRPLMGESPLLAAMADVAAGSAMTQQQINFYNNEARPSAVISTDLVLEDTEVQQLKDRWNEAAKGLRTGGVPILTAGLKVQPWAASAKDAQLAEVMKFTEQHIALVFRVPLAILGIGGTPYSSTELLMQSWIASGLGFALNHIEEAFGLLFELKGQPDEYAEFDTGALLRSAMKDRIDALARGVQGGIFAPNEARASEGFDAVAFGDEPRVQQQVIPLSFAGQMPAAPAAPAAVPPVPIEKPIPIKGHAEDVQREVRHILTTANRIARRRLSS